MQPMAKRSWRLFWLTVLVGHPILALAWWGLSPGGFRPDHPRFWTNRVAPPLVLGLSIAALGGAQARRLRSPANPLAGLGSRLGRGCHHATNRVSDHDGPTLVVPLAAASVMGMAAIPPWRGPGERRWSAGAFLLAIASALAGAISVGALRPPALATHPRNDPLAPVEILSRDSARTPPGSVRFDSGAMVQTHDGSLTARFAPLTITIQPLLTFLNGSPDGSPTVLVPARNARAPSLGFVTGGKKETGLRLVL